MIERNVMLKGLKRQELDDQIQALLQKAIDATANAWAPYSRFHVGAAVLLDNDEMLSGSNQENAAYPSGLCAERTLLFHLGHTRPHQRILAMAITAVAPEYHIPEPLCPCGACLQVMAEQVKRQHSDFDVFLYSGTDTVFMAQGVKQFLPFAFELRKK